MSSFLRNSLWIAPILLFASVVTAQTASANSVAQRNTARANAYGPSGSKLQDNVVFSDRVRLIMEL